MTPAPRSSAALAANRLTDAIDLAAAALERLAREQDFVAVDAAFYGESTFANTAALVTSRGEAARAVAALYEALPVNENADGPATRARQQVVFLHNVDAIPSATLRVWAAGWRALAGSAS